MDVLIAVGEKIRIIRKGHGLSQEELGEKTGLSANYIGLVERGQKQVTIVTLDKISEALGVELSILFEDHKAKSKKSPTESEIFALVNYARTIKFEDLKTLRRLAERFTKIR